MNVLDPTAPKVNIMSNLGARPRRLRSVWRLYVDHYPQGVSVGPARLGLSSGFVGYVPVIDRQTAELGSVLKRFSDTPWRRAVTLYTKTSGISSTTANSKRRIRSPSLDSDSFGLFSTASPTADRFYSAVSGPRRQRLHLRPAISRTSIL